MRFAGGVEAGGEDLDFVARVGWRTREGAEEGEGLGFVGGVVDRRGRGRKGGGEVGGGADGARAGWERRGRGRDRGRVGKRGGEGGRGWGGVEEFGEVLLARSFIEMEA